MTLRRFVGFALLVLGLWLGWGALQAMLAFTQRGGDVAGYLFEPPTGILRFAATVLMVLGGGLVALKARFGALVGLGGAIIYALLGGIMALSGADMGLWLDEVLYAVGAIGICVLVFSLQRQ